MADTSMTIRTDSVVKKQAQQVFSELGLDMTTAVNLFLRQAIRQNGIPFELKLDTPNAATLKAMEEASKGMNLHGPFDTVEALMEDLNA